MSELSNMPKTPIFQAKESSCSCRSIEQHEQQADRSATNPTQGTVWYLLALRSEASVGIGNTIRTDFPRSQKRITPNHVKVEEKFDGTCEPCEMR